MAALKITGQSAAPTPVTESDKGTLYYDSDTNKLRHYNGTAWADVPPAAAALTSADLPAGSVLQTKGDIYNRTSSLAVETSSERLIGADLQVGITCNSTSNYMRVSCFLPSLHNNGTAGRSFRLGFRYSITNASYDDNWSSSDLDLGIEWIDDYVIYASSGVIFPIFYETWVAVPTVSPMNIQVATQAITGSCTMWANAGAGSEVGSLIVQESKT